MTVVLASVAFWAPVTLAIIGDDGKREVIQFRGRYRRLKSSERAALDARLAAGIMTDSRRASQRARLDDPTVKLIPSQRRQWEAELAADPIDDDEFLREMLVDWDLKNKRGEAIPYTHANLAEACEEWDGIERALVMAYFNALRDAQQIQAVEKNSGEPSATGS